MDSFPTTGTNDNYDNDDDDDDDTGVSLCNTIKFLSWLKVLHGMFFSSLMLQLILF